MTHSRKGGSLGCGVSFLFSLRSSAFADFLAGDEGTCYYWLILAFASSLLDTSVSGSLKDLD